MPRAYTRKGDRGSTSLANGKQVSKADPVISSIGQLDLLNVYVQSAILSLDDALLRDEMNHISSTLFSLGALLAQARQQVFKGKEETDQLEQWIDALDAQLKPLHNFILPGGTRAASQMHLCRATCRQLETSLAAAVVDAVPVLMYVNRLSSYFFVAARYLSQGHEQIWRP